MIWIKQSFLNIRLLSWARLRVGELSTPQYTKTPLEFIPREFLFPIGSILLGLYFLIVATNCT